MSDLQKLFQEARADAEAMKAEIKLLKSQAALKEASGLGSATASFAAPTFQEKVRAPEDRDRNIVGRWPWVPHRALRKQIDEILKSFNQGKAGNELLEILTIDICSPRASFAFIKFKSSADYTSQDNGY